MERHANSLVELRFNDGMDATTITPGWVFENCKRRHVQNPFIDRILGRLFPDQRRHPRFSAPPIVAYLGTAGSSRIFPIINVSVGGFCLRADEFWSPGIVMPITLQRWRTIPQDDLETITLQAMLVRREGDTAGFTVALTSDESQQFPPMWIQRASSVHSKMMSFLKDLPEPEVTRPASPIHAAMSANMICKAQSVEMRLGSASSPKALSAEAAQFQAGMSR
jgi:hypothetical protein